MEGKLCTNFNVPTSSNYGLFKTRLKSLHHKLKNEPNLLRNYHEIIKDQERKGIVERVQEPTALKEEMSKDVIIHPTMPNL